MFKFKKYKVTFTMKSGDKLILKCENCVINTVDGVLNSYELTGVSEGTKPLYIRIESIDHIISETYFSIF